MAIPFDDSVSKKVVDEHNCIKRDLNRILETIQSKILPDSFVEWKLEYIWRIRDFRNVLLKHFDLEESGGFITEIVKQAPEKAANAKQLNAEHGKIIRNLDQIISHIKFVENYDEVALKLIREEVEKFVESLRNHETKENELVQKAFYQEYGYPS